MCTASPGSACSLATDGGVTNGCCPTCTASLQRGNLRAAAKALGEPTESECGLSVDTDVAEESNRQRKRCAVYLRQAGGGSAAPAEAVLLPAQVALMPLADSGAAGTAGTAPAAGAAGAKLATGEGEDPSLAGRPYAVEMFGLRKAYKVRRWGTVCVCASGGLMNVRA